MTFYEILDRVIALLQRHRRVTYRALKRQFDLDDAYLEDLKAELIQARHVASDEDGSVLVWTGDMGLPPLPAVPPARDTERIPRVAPPPHLAAQILTSRAALAGERKQVTVLFADIKGSTELIQGLDPEEARRLLDPARARAEELGMLPLMAHCHAGLGILYAQTGHREPARAELAAAIARYQAMGMTLWLPQMEAAMAQV